jgi:hypothetical protein
MCETPYAYSWFWAMPRGVETSPISALRISTGYGELVVSIKC